MSTGMHHEDKVLPDGYYRRDYGTLTIYGVYVESTHPEDVAYLKSMGREHVWAYSVACVEGEMGSEPYPTPYTQITKEEFETAQANEWKEKP